MSRPTKAVILAVILLAIVAAGWWALSSGDPTGFAKGKRVELADFKGPDPTGAPADLAKNDLVARGEYLTRAADCAACHTAPGSKPFAGGLPFKLPMIGTIYSTNITPDQETGIGAWSDEEFLRALHQGIGKGGKHLYPAFPYASYALMTDSDVLAIKAYLFTLKPVKYTPPPNDISFPLNQRYLMTFWNALFKPSHRFRPNADQPADWNRGAYLVEALGHCSDCHTPRNLLFAVNNKRKFAGAMIQGWKAYNITPDHEWGIGSWSDGQLEGYLSAGHAEGRGSAGGPMSEVVDNSLRYLTEPDIKAIATYLKSGPPMAMALTLLRLPLPRWRGRSAISRRPLKKVDPACSSLKEPASAVTSSTAREPSRITHRSSAAGPRTTPLAPTQPRPSSGELILASSRPRASCPISERATQTRRLLR
jgi:mono/diheme cytochrome c family protein